MKLKCIILFSVLLLIHQVIQAQAEVIRVKAGEDISKAISNYGKYRFDSFRQGRLYYTYGKTATARFNYNYLIEEMQFINPESGDTLAIAYPDQVKFIKFDSTVFYYNEGFMEIINDYDTVQIAAKQKIKISFEKIGAYNQPNATDDIDNNQTYVDEHHMYYKLIINQDAIIKKQIDWYLFTSDNERPVRADKAGFEKLYPGHTSAIRNFLKTKKDGLKDLESITQLLLICCDRSIVR